MNGPQRLSLAGLFAATSVTSTGIIPTSICGIPTDPCATSAGAMACECIAQIEREVLQGGGGGETPAILAFQRIVTPPAICFSLYDPCIDNVWNCLYGIVSRTWQSYDEFGSGITDYEDELHCTKAYYTERARMEGEAISWVNTALSDLEVPCEGSLTAAAPPRHDDRQEEHHSEAGPCSLLRASWRTI